MTIHRGLPDALAERVDARLRSWDNDGVPERFWARDYTLWGQPDGREITDRMGWLEAPSRISDFTGRAVEIASELKTAETRHLVLLGMGGSSLAPEVFRRVLGGREGAPELILLDSTHPGSVAPVLATTRPEETVCIVASKSGGTIETMSLFHVFWARAEESLEEPGKQFIAITDPETSLSAMADERGFRACFLADPNVGGRYSALTPFGIVPAAILGNEPGPLEEAATRMAEACGPNVGSGENPGFVLAACLVEAALAGRDKLTLLTSDQWSAFPIWVEQLVAESLGKDGQGVVPVAEEGGGVNERWSDDRLYAVLRTSTDELLESRVAALRETGDPVLEWIVDDPAEVAAEMYRWEFAIGAAAVGLGVHPFDQPDVQIAKTRAKEAMAGSSGSGSSVPELLDLDGDLGVACNAWLEDLSAGEYLGLQAYMPPGPEVDDVLEALRRALRDRYGVVVTLGYGPRFLHSTGQLHKGGADIGRFLQLFSEPEMDLKVPSTDYTLGRLVRAQADGDAGALVERGRKLLRLRLGGPDDLRFGGALAQALGLSA